MFFHKFCHRGDHLLAGVALGAGTSFADVSTVEILTAFRRHLIINLRRIIIPVVAGGTLLAVAVIPLTV